MDLSNKNTDWPVLVARKIGAQSFRRWDNTELGSLGSRYLGKVLNDCKFRFGDSQRGILGTSKVPASVIYVDLTFHQPKGHRLASASVQISLQEYEPTNYTSARDKRKGQVNSLASGLAVTDKFGPQMLTGKPTTRFGNADGIVSGGATYKTLKWGLSENDFISQSQAHSSVVHTGFAITHEAKPFYIKVKIDGKLRKVSDRLKSVFVFPPRSRKDQGTALTLLRLGPQHRSGLPLDSLARGLKDAMLQRNLHALPRELPDALPAAGSGRVMVPASEDVSGTMEDAAAPPSYTTEEPERPADNDIEMLSAALTTFAAVTEEEGFDESATTSPTPAAELSRNKPVDISNTEVIAKRVDEKGIQMVEDRVRHIIEGAKRRTKDISVA
ncbi:hypothetical protein GE09DRAFT_1222243 [Coniochaeta sp. 2T2.1]|nr:hypothetical protein GE09DRAFT_1222243 [Coniochaeta sp. 2T2.1]